MSNPRVHLTYDVEGSPGIEIRELPFVIAVFGDFAPGSAALPADPRDREFLKIDCQSLDQALALLQPRLHFEASQTELRFDRMSDFEPEGILRQARVPRGKIDGILHTPAFQKLEAAWRGLEYLASTVRPVWHVSVRVQLFPLSKTELADDVLHRGRIEDSVLFQKIYRDVSRSPFVDPFSLLLGDYEFDHGAQDVEMLSRIARICATAHAPFLAGAAPAIFGWQDFRPLFATRWDTLNVFRDDPHHAWRELQHMEEARYLCLALPRFLLRGRYQDRDLPSEWYSEEARPSAHAGFLWGNAAFCLGRNIIRSFQRFRWPAAISGVEEGGLIEGLSSIRVESAEGAELVGPVEAGVDDRQEAVLSACGLACLTAHKGSASQATFFSVPTLYRPVEVPPGHLNALPVQVRAWGQLGAVLAISRVVHHVLAISRDQIPDRPPDWEPGLNAWIEQYVGGTEGPPELRALRPLQHGRIEVREVDGEPGQLVATVSLHPAFQFESWLSAEPPQPVAVRLWHDWPAFATPAKETRESLDIHAELRDFTERGFRISEMDPTAEGYRRISVAREAREDNFQLYASEGGWRFRRWSYVPGPGPDDTDCGGGAFSEAVALAAQYFFGQPALIDGWLFPLNRHPDWDLSRLKRSVAAAARLSYSQWRELRELRRQLFRLRDQAYMSMSRSGAGVAPDFADLNYIPIDHSDPGAGILWLRMDLGEACIVQPEETEVTAALASEDHELREEALDYCRQAGPRGVPALTSALQDPFPYLQQRACEALLTVAKGSKEALDALIAAGFSSNRGLRLRAIRCLGRVGAPNHDVVEALQHILCDEDREIREEALNALRRLGSS